MPPGVEPSGGGSRHVKQHPQHRQEEEGGGEVQSGEVSDDGGGEGDIHHQLGEQLVVLGPKEAGTAQEEAKEDDKDKGGRGK